MTLQLARPASGAAITAVAIKSASVSIGFNCLGIVFAVLSVEDSVVEASSIAGFVLSVELQDIKMPVNTNAVIIRFICLSLVFLLVVNLLIYED